MFILFGIKVLTMFASVSKIYILTVFQRLSGITKQEYNLLRKDPGLSALVVSCWLLNAGALLLSSQVSMWLTLFLFHIHPSTTAITY
jgi:hypothetical protein